MDLVCWQLADHLKLRIYTLCEREGVRSDVRFRDQIRDAAASAPRNIAEGFGRRSHKDFARLLDVARASLNECQNHLKDARDRGYLTQDELQPLWELSCRALAATAALQRHLRRTP